MNNKMPKPYFGNWISDNEFKPTTASTNSILIDSVNVAGCKYTNGLYNGVYGCINLNLNPACSKNPNCHFKQLKRLEAENERLKMENEHLDEKEEEARHYLNEVYKYKQALEDIKTELLQNNCANSKEIRSVLAIIDEVLNE